MPEVDRLIRLPPWAEEIEVQPVEVGLVVTGRGLLFQPLDAESSRGLGRDLLSLFYDGDKTAPHLQFANAKTDRELIAFVKQFGPVQASAHGAPGSDSFGDHGSAAIVLQRMDILRAEQAIFSKLLELIYKLILADDWLGELLWIEHRFWESPEWLITQKEEGEGAIWSIPTFARSLAALADKRTDKARTHRQELGDLLGLLTELDESSRSYPSIENENGWGSPYPDHPPISPFPFLRDPACSIPYIRDPIEQAVSLIKTSHQYICSVVSAFPPSLYAQVGKTSSLGRRPEEHFAATVIELPEFGARGIRPLLYFMLREHYRRKRQLKACKRSSCNRFFVPRGKLHFYCSERCENNDASARSYAKNKAAKRRKKRLGRAKN